MPVENKIVQIIRLKLIQFSFILKLILSKKSAKLKKFIKDNNLEFNSGSGGDSNILALTGYACFIGASLEDCLEVVDEIDTHEEIERVYNYASTHNYEKWWNTPDAKKQYKF